jgi:hypothetical protein
MHCCGYIRDIMPDFVASGLDVFQFDQVRIYDLDDLARSFGGETCFFCPVDIQATMPTGDRERIREDARLMIEKLGTREGGFMAKDYPTWDAVGVDPEWAEWMRDAFREFGSYA